MSSVDPSLHFSIYNDYAYSEKSKTLVVLDTLSIPVRTLFGGRKINLLNCEDEKEASTARKVLLLVLSIVIFPVGLISSAALLLKTALHEKHALMDEYRKTQSLIRTKLDQSASDFLREYLKHPVLHIRKDIQKKLLSSLEEIVKKPALEEATFDLFSYLSPQEKITLIASYVKHLYRPHDDRDLFKIDTSSLIVTIHKLYPNCPLKEKVELFEKIVQETCRLQDSPTYLYTLFKADLFFYLHSILLRIKTELKRSEGEERSFAKQTAEIELETIRIGLFNDSTLINTDLRTSLEVNWRIGLLKDLEELKAFYDSKDDSASLLNAIQDQPMPYPKGLDLDKKVKALFDDLKTKSRAELIAQHDQLLSEIQSHREAHQVEMSARLKIILIRIKKEIDALSE